MGRVNELSLSHQSVNDTTSKKKSFTDSRSYLTIQNQAIQIIPSLRPRPHSSLNPLSGNSLY